MLQAAALIVAFLAFYCLAPWLSAQPTSNAPSSVLAALPAHCPAYWVNHGTYYCEWRDTIENNLLGFAINLGILVGSFWFAYFLSHTRRGFSMRHPAEPDRSES